MKTKHTLFIKLPFSNLIQRSSNLPSSSHQEINFNLVGNEDSQHLLFYSLSQTVEQRNHSLQDFKSKVFGWVSRPLHGGGGQVSVLVLQPPVQGQPSLLLVVAQHGRDGQGALEGAIGFHCLSGKHSTGIITLD